VSRAPEGDGQGRGASLAALLAAAGAPPATLGADDDALLGEIALLVRRRGLETPAVLWLESLRPLSFLGAQAMHFLAPFVQAFVPADRFRRLAIVLEERGNMERLVRLIETAAGQDDLPARGGGGA